ncbi:HAD-IIB family hydrolase [Zymobacter palmae]|uniref:Predicted hydrolases of the HAD superfamily n=1 Tax=Zymobacter palmae TaxID=33074 RepID=A0A348HGC4_9GAMM|nr:HAD family hydrolase [Zymobacter palmae]BBG30676.1 predicted hydrolases of the HAD superfamily [Zymobacter palmae]
MRYAIFDIDGTISQAGQPISSSVAEALLALREHYQVVFASARPVRDMLPLLPDELHDAVMVGCNGGMAWQRGEFMINEKFDADSAASMLGWLDNARAAYVVESHWQYGFSPIAHDFHDYVRSLNVTFPPAERDTVMAQGVNKILILDMALREPLLEYLSAQPFNVVEKLHRFDHCFDLMPGQTDKVNALDRLAIAPEQAIIFGNDLNDQAMLARAAHSVVVGEFQPATPPHQRVAFDEVAQAITALADKVAA